MGAEMVCANSLMTALEMLNDMVEDPKNNGDYRLNIQGEKLLAFWTAVENSDKMLRAVIASTDLESAIRRARKGIT